MKSIHLKYLVFLLMVVACKSQQNESDQKQPYNVFFISVDDLKWFDQFAGGEQVVHTPNLDRLAAKSQVFTNAYCQAPGCAPSRSSLLSGLRPSTTGAYGFQHQTSLDTSQLNWLPEQFRKNNYFTTGSGKIEHATKKGVQRQSWDEYYPSFKKHKVKYYGDLYDSTELFFNLRYGKTKTPEDSITSGVEANWVAERIASFPDKLEEPFFMGYGCFHPHLPWYAPKKYYDLYDTANIVLPKVLDDDQSDLPEMGKYMADMFYRDDSVISTLNKRKEVVQAYYASVSFADAQIGKVLDALEKSPHAENTIVVLWSDHGWQFGGKKAYRKFTLWKNAAQVPLMIYIPGMQPQKITSAAELIDIYPTLLELCDISLPKQKLDGKSLMPFIQGGKKEKAAVTTWGRGNHAVATDTFRYIRYFNGEEELYDIIQDPLEWENLALDENQTEIIARLKQYLPTDSVKNLDRCPQWSKVRSIDYPTLERNPAIK